MKLGFVICVLVVVFCMSVSAGNIFIPGSELTGWYDAPLGFGRTDFTATVVSYDDQTGDFNASGTDSQGDFTLKGKVEGDEVSIVKDYVASDGYKNIKYRGTVENDEVKGTYKFRYKALFIDIPIHENFYIKVTA